MNRLITIITSLPDKCLHPNARNHWRVKALATKRQRERTGAEATIARSRMPGGWEAVKEASIRLRYLFPAPLKGGIQRHDPDNLVSLAKASIDGLQDGGILTDDREVIYLPPTQKFAKKTHIPHAGQLQIDIRRIDGCELIMFDQEELELLRLAIRTQMRVGTFKAAKMRELLAWFEELK